MVISIRYLGVTDFYVDRRMEEETMTIVAYYISLFSSPVFAVAYLLRSPHDQGVMLVSIYFAIMALIFKPKEDK